MKYEFLKKYIAIDEKENNEWPCIFYQVTDEMITNAETRMNRTFPKELVELYKTIGYGYFEDPEGFCINLLMSPKEIADFCIGEGDYFYAEEREFLNVEDMVFFEIESNNHIIIKTAGEFIGKIFYGSKKIADDMEEFINKIYSNTEYYME